MNNQQSAFPNDLPSDGYLNRGLTKRELFAAMAMQGFLANNRVGPQLHLVAKESVIQADALIVELEKAQQPTTKGTDSQ